MEVLALRHSKQQLQTLKALDLEKCAMVEGPEAMLQEHAQVVEVSGVEVEILPLGRFNMQNKITQLLEI